MRGCQRFELIYMFSIINGGCPHSPPMSPFPHSFPHRVTPPAALSTLKPHGSPSGFFFIGLRDVPSYTRRMETRIVKDKVSRAKLRALAEEQYGDMVKAVVDVEQAIMGAGGELHVDIQS